jgi:hypothetical protein
MTPSRFLSQPMIGAASGFLATLPMSLFLLAAQRLLPRHERYPLPPFGQITNILANKLGLGHTKNTPPHKAATAVSHFSYGSAAGSLYGSVAPWLPFSSTVSGLLYGLFVWAASYFGLLPALRILPPANRQPRERTIVMVLAHVMWGVTLGLLVHSLKGKRR